jgi:hypothetical protein
LPLFAEFFGASGKYVYHRIKEKTTVINIGAGMAEYTIVASSAAIVATSYQPRANYGN